MIVVFLDNIRLFSDRKSQEAEHDFGTYRIYAQIPLINEPADASSLARRPNFGLSILLRLCFGYASSQGSGVSVHMHRHARAFAAY